MSLHQLANYIFIIFLNTLFVSLGRGSVELLTTTIPKGLLLHPFNLTVSPL